ARQQNNRAYWPDVHAVAKTASLLQGRLSGGMPEREATATKKTTNVILRSPRMPPMSLMYFEWAVWMSTPAAMKRAALKIAWLMRWKRLAESPCVKLGDRAVRQRAIIMY